MSKTLTVTIPDDIHRIFKIKMVIENKTMKERIIELIEADANSFNEFKSDMHLSEEE